MFLNLVKVRIARGADGELNTVDDFEQFQFSIVIDLFQQVKVAFIPENLVLGQTAVQIFNQLNCLNWAPHLLGPDV